MKTKLRRSVAALATAVACLALMATPAAATTHTATTTGGNLTFFTSFGTTGLFDLNPPLAGSGGTDCGSTLAIDEDGTGAVDVTQYTSASRFTLGGSHFIVVMTRQGSTAGTYSGGTISSATLSLRVDIFFATNTSSTATDCAHGTTRSCRYTLTLHLTGTYTGWTASSTLQLAGSSGTVVSSPPCVAPFTTFSGGTAVITAWDIHLTT